MGLLSARLSCVISFVLGYYPGCEQITLSQRYFHLALGFITGIFLKLQTSSWLAFFFLPKPPLESVHRHSGCILPSTLTFPGMEAQYISLPVLSVNHAQNPAESMILLAQKDEMYIVPCSS